MDDNISSCSAANGGNDSTTAVRRIVIVGGGFAGLSAAYHLQKALLEHSRTSPSLASLEVVVLEGRQRLGGRVWPCSELGVDLGGQWVHEACPIRNPICQLMAEFGLKFCGDDKKKKNKNKKTSKTLVFNTTDSVLNDIDEEKKEAAAMAIPAARQLDPLLLRRMSRAFYQSLDDVDSNCGNNNSIQNGNNDTSLWNALQNPDSALQRFIQQAALHKKKNDSDVNCCVQYLMHGLEIYEGGPLSELSALLQDLYQQRPGRDRVPKGTYGALLNKLEEHMFLRHRVDGHKKKKKNFNKKHLVNDDDNTGPPKLDMQLRLGCGVTEIHCNDNNDDKNQNKKITISYYQQQPHNDGDSRGDNPSTASTMAHKTIQADVCICTVPLGVLEDHTISFQPPLPPPVQQAIQAMGFGAMNKVVLQFDERFWPEDWGRFTAVQDTTVTSFYDVSNDAGRPTLIQFVGGTTAQQFEAGSDEQAVQNAMNALRHMLENDTAVPIQPHTYRVTRWVHDPWSRGSYSFAKVGSTEEDYLALTRPLYHGHLLLAGEHTSPHAHATVHGAWESGQRAAEQAWSAAMGEPLTL